MTRILVVEDEGIIALDIKASLERLGYKVIDTVSRGEDAVRVAAHEHPDLVLMDIHLEGAMDGIEAAAQIREGSDIPVVYLTAYTDEETLSRAKITQPFGYAVKPFQERELHSAIEVGIYKHTMERQVRLQRDHLDAILRSVGDGIVVFDEEGKLRFLNRAAAKLLNCDPDAVVGQTMPAMMTLQSEEGAGMDLKATHRLGRPVNGTLTLADGHELPIEATVTQVVDAAGKEEGWVLTFRDISLRRRTEETLQRLASIVETTDDAMVSVDREGHVLTWNPGAERLLGLEADQAVGRSIETFFTGAARNEAPSVRRALREGAGYERRDLTITRGDGAPTDVDLLVTPLRETDGRPWGASIILTDVTRRALVREAESVRQALRDRASQLI